MLRKKSRPSLHKTRLPAGICLERTGCSNRVRVAFLPLKAKRNRRSELRHYILQQSNLRAVPILQQNLYPAVLVEIRKRKGSAVLNEIETNNSRHIGKSSVTIIQIKDVAF